MNTDEKEIKKQESPWSFRPDDDIRALLSFAKSRTRMSTSELVNAALRKCGSECLDSYFEGAAKGREDFNVLRETLPAISSAAAAPTKQTEKPSVLNALEDAALRSKREAAAPTVKVSRQKPAAPSK